MPKSVISPAQARRIALAAQGFGGAGRGSAGGGQASAGGARGSAGAGQGSAAVRPVGTRQLNLAIERLGLLQIDSVNVFERSHYVPLFARLGPYDRALLDRLTFSPRGRYVEYWAHEAAFLPVSSWPLWRWKMREHRDADAADADSWASANRPILDLVRAELRAQGPLPASAIDHEANVRSGPWWGWSDVKRGLEVLFRTGEVVSAGRTRFERTYALPDQVLPSEVLDVEVSRGDAHRALVSHAAGAVGIGTASDIADYFRLRTADTVAALRDLEDEGVVHRVEVPGWRREAFLHRDARVPRRVDADALLSPFDPVVWERDRAERLFGFRYRIEIYTPQPKRVYGYYVLPVLQGDSLVGRVDLKSERQTGVLRVQAAWQEPGHTLDPERLARLLRRTADWQGLGDVVVAGRGDFAEPLEGALRRL